MPKILCLLEIQARYLLFSLHKIKIRKQHRITLLAYPLTLYILHMGVILIISKVFSIIFLLCLWKQGIPWHILPSAYLFLDSEPQLDKSEEFNNQRMKRHRAFRIYSPKKINKKGDRLWIKFSSNQSTGVQRCLNPLFQRPLCLLSPLF